MPFTRGNSHGYPLTAPSCGLGLRLGGGTPRPLPEPKGSAQHLTGPPNQPWELLGCPCWLRSISELRGLQVVLEDRGARGEH